MSTMIDTRLCLLLFNISYFFVGSTISFLFSFIFGTVSFVYIYPKSTKPNIESIENV